MKTLVELEREQFDFDMLNKVHNEDCLEFMKRLPDDYFDLILTDPPYGIGLSSNPIRQKHTAKDWDDKTPSDEIFSEMFRVSKNQIIWGANYFNLPASKNFIVWDKKQSYDFSLAMAELAYTSYDFPAKIFSYANRGDEHKHHPTQKPVDLMDFCLVFATSREDIKTIYDPFTGSGTSLISAKKLGIEYCGTELDPEYCAIANKRINKVVEGACTKSKNQSITQKTMF